MADAEFQDFDLFGDPVPAAFAGKGRPPHCANIEKARVVILLAAVGKKKPEIAKALGITQPTLNKHYFSKASQWRIPFGEARERIEAKLLAKLFDGAMEGNVAANRALWDRLDKAEAKELAAKFQSPAPEEKTVKLGKKEQQQAAAADVAGLYAPPPAPGALPN